MVYVYEHVCVCQTPACYSNTSSTLEGSASHSFFYSQYLISQNLICSNVMVYIWNIPSRVMVWTLMPALVPVWRPGSPVEGGLATRSISLVKDLWGLYCFCFQSVLSSSSSPPGLYGNNHHHKARMSLSDYHAFSTMMDWEIPKPWVKLNPSSFKLLMRKHKM